MQGNSVNTAKLIRRDQQNNHKKEVELLMTYPVTTSNREPYTDRSNSVNVKGSGLPAYNGFQCLSPKDTVESAIDIQLQNHKVAKGYISKNQANPNECKEVYKDFVGAMTKDRQDVNNLKTFKSSRAAISAVKALDSNPDYINTLIGKFNLLKQGDAESVKGSNGYINAATYNLVAYLHGIIANLQDTDGGKKLLTSILIQISQVARDEVLKHIQHTQKDGELSVNFVLLEFPEGGCSPNNGATPFRKIDNTQELLKQRVHERKGEISTVAFSQLVTNSAFRAGADQKQAQTPKLRVNLARRDSVTETLRRFIIPAAHLGTPERSAQNRALTAELLASLPRIMNSTARETQRAVLRPISENSSTDQVLGSVKKNIWPQSSNQGASSDKENIPPNKLQGGFGDVIDREGERLEEMKRIAEAYRKSIEALKATNQRLQKESEQLEEVLEELSQYDDVKEFIERTKLNIEVDESVSRLSSTTYDQHDLDEYLMGLNQQYQKLKGEYSNDREKYRQDKRYPPLRKKIEHSQSLRSDIEKTVDVLKQLELVANQELARKAKLDINLNQLNKLLIDIGDQSKLFPPFQRILIRGWSGGLTDE